MTDEEQYLDKFRGKYLGESNIRSAALQTAIDTRKFEIDLYWKRATYFWAFIAASFAGYFAILAAAGMSDKDFLSLIVANLGFFFTLAFFLVNKGSKFWQENWENHVAVLGKAVVGPLFNLVLRRPDEPGGKADFITDPGPFSVSKINQWVSAYLLAIWLILTIRSVFVMCLHSWSWLGIVRVLVVLATTATFGRFMWKHSRTDFDTHRPVEEFIDTVIGHK